MRDQLLQTLAGMGIDTSDPQVAGMTDDQLQALVNQMNGGAFTEKMKAKFAAPPNPDADGKGKLSDPPADQSSAMYAEFKKFAEDCTKRMGAMEQAVGDLSKAKSDVAAATAFASRYEEDQKAAHKSLCEREIARLVDDGKIEPRDKDVFLAALIGKDNRNKFSDAESKGNAGKTAFEVALAELHAREPSKMFSREVTAPAGGGPVDDDFVNKALAATGKGRVVQRELAKK